MNKEETGGPAFPYEERNMDGMPFRDYFGITVLDYFAAHAPAPPDTWRAKKDDAENIIAWRWAYAYAMLEARPA